jgi:hypothetical protein
MPLRYLVPMVLQLVGIFVLVTAATLAFGLVGFLAAGGLVLYVAGEEFTPEQPTRIVVVRDPDAIEDGAPRAWTGD